MVTEFADIKFAIAQIQFNNLSFDKERNVIEANPSTHRIALYVQELIKSIVGEPLEGEHPDEANPRAANFLEERRNWQKEVGMLNEQIQKYNTRRKEVFSIIEKERDYQVSNEDTSHPHIVSSLNMGGILTAIQYNLSKAQGEWYNEKQPYQHTTDLLRKIAALCVKAGEDYGMSPR